MSQDSKLVAKKLSNAIVQLRNRLDGERCTPEATEQYITLFVAKSLLSECEMLTDKNQIVSAYFNLHVRSYLYDVLSQLNERTVVQVDPILDLTKRLYIERYQVACGMISDSVLSAWMWQDNMPKGFVPNDVKPHKFVKHLSEVSGLLSKDTLL